MEFLKSVIPTIENSEFAKTLSDSSQLKALHELIYKKGVTTDEEAFSRLYNGSEVHPNTFKKLKQRLRDRVTEFVLHSGVSKRSLDEYARQYRKCLNQALAVKTLMLSYARPAGAYIGENLVKATLKYEYTDLTLFIGRELYNYYTAINHVPSKQRKYEKIINRAQELYNREIEAGKYYGDLRAVFNSSRGLIKESVLERADQYCKKVRPYLKSDNTSYQLLAWIYEILTMRCEIAQDYEQLLAISEEAVATFKKRNISRKYIFFRFDMNKIICFIQYGQNNKVEKLANSYLQQMASGSLNWYGLKIYVLVSRLHTQRYQEAYVTMTEMRYDRNYEKLPETLRQMLIVYEAHLEFLITIGIVKGNSISKFRLYKFLNEIPIYTKDKRGLNISILILHVLFLLAQRKHSRIIDRIDALNQYCHRHLRRDETFRSNCFIKMLLQMAKADFNRMRTERYVQPYLKKLESMPLNVSDQSIEVEIIPYEDLWILAINLLD